MWKPPQDWGKKPQGQPMRNPLNQQANTRVLLKFCPKKLEVSTKQREIQRLPNQNEKFQFLTTSRPSKGYPLGRAQRVILISGTMVEHKRKARPTASSSSFLPPSSSFYFFSFFEASAPSLLHEKSRGKTQSSGCPLQLGT